MPMIRFCHKCGAQLTQPRIRRRALYCTAVCRRQAESERRSTTKSPASSGNARMATWEALGQFAIEQEESPNGIARRLLELSKPTRPNWQ